MFALRTPLYLELGIAFALTAGAIALAPRHEPESVPVMPETSCDIPPLVVAPIEPSCVGVKNVVIRGWLTAQDPSFSIQFPGKHFHYSAISNAGYFEVRIPADDFDGDICSLRTELDTFTDDQMTVRFRVDLER